MKLIDLSYTKTKSAQFNPSSRPIFAFILSAFLILSFTHSAQAEISVIVHPSNQDLFEEHDIVRIYLGRTRAFPSGKEVVPLGFREGSAEHSEFCKNALSKSPKQLKAYWAKMVFTGKGTPPREMDSYEDILQLIANNPNFIGYIPTNKVSENVKVIWSF